MFAELNDKDLAASTPCVVQLHTHLLIVTLLSAHIVV